MRKHTRLSVILFASVLLFVLAGCTTKKYANLEEWYNDKGASDKLMEQTHLENSEAVIDVVIQENDIVYVCKFKEKVFGLPNGTDGIVKSYLQKDLEKNRTVYTELIKQLSAKSGIDSGLLTVRMDYYNPGAAKPSLTQTITVNN